MNLHDEYLVEIKGEKVTTIGLTKDTLHKFNCRKVKENFESADLFINYLLDFFQEKRKTAKRGKGLKLL